MAVTAAGQPSARPPSPAAKPVLGTQSLVGVMARVWKRPGLLGMELLWRWTAALPLLALAWWAGARALRGVPFERSALEQMTVFQPAQAVALLDRQLALAVPRLFRVACWWVPLALAVWSTASALGRTATWQLLDRTLRPRPLITGLCGLLRLLGLLCTLAVWASGLRAAADLAITRPARLGAEPNLVLYAALCVALTLVLFMLWSVCCWIFDSAPLFAMDSIAGPATGWRAAFRAAFHARSLRSKLVEMNFVMGIVKVALLVLATVFSATPLPFSSVETPGFLALWWSGVGVAYLVASDLFHVVRRAATLDLFQATVQPKADTLVTPSRGVHAS